MEQLGPLLPAIVILLAVLICVLVFWGYVFGLLFQVGQYLYRWAMDGHRPVSSEYRRVLAEKRNPHIMGTVLLFILMLGITFWMALKGKFVLAVCLGIMAVLILVMILRMKQDRKEEVGLVYELKNADKRKLFSNQTYTLAAAWHSVLLKEDFFREPGTADSIRESYEMIREAIEHDVQSAVNFMQHYDWIQKPDPKYLNKTCSHADALAKKLSELSDIVLEINDSASDVDISFADNMLESLKELVSGNKEE